MGSDMSEEDDIQACCISLAWKQESEGLGVGVMVL